MRFKHQKLKCRHGEFSLAIDPIVPGLLLHGTDITEFGTPRVARQWAIENTCDCHEILEINLEGKKGRKP